jgi:hypothetical protein
MAEETDNSEEGTITLRVPADLMEFIEDQAKAQFNTRAGIVRLALAKFRDSRSHHEGGPGPGGVPKPQSEMAS